MQTIQPATPRAYRWSRTVYERLAESGTFEDQRVELIGAQVVEMSPKGPRHAAVTNRVRKALERAFPAARFTVRPEQPLALSEWDEPEPDVAIADGDDLDYIDAHPTVAQTRLDVEVADTTASYDLGYKAAMYAAAGILDCWVVLPAEREVVVCRRPAANSESLTGMRYAERQRYRAGETVTPLAAPDRAVPVADLLP